jgi:molybdopterin-guanine dinucleotide biosynthesis protein A
MVTRPHASAVNACLRFSAVVLAAGRSSRMGRDKALLELDGTPLWRRQRDLLAAAGAAEIFLSARPDQSWVAQARSEFAAVLHDAFPGGPLVGVTAALERASHAHVAVLAIDLPRMEPEWFAALGRDCAPRAGVVGWRGECFEPLAAIYPREAKFAAWESLARGDYALQPLLRSLTANGVMRVREITAAQVGWFENRNEPPEN